jgi:competence protein ComEC
VNKVLRIHFLNVGHGDCTVIEHPDGHLTVIDINNGVELDLESTLALAKAYKLPIFSQLDEIHRDRRSFINRLGVSKARQFVTATERQALDELVRKGYDIKLTNPVDFISQRYKSKTIFRYIQTHPDLDHMGGLTALRSQKIEIVNFWDTEHDKTPEFQSDSDKEEWAAYLKLRTGNGGAKVLRLYRGSRGSYWNQDSAGTEGGDGIDILSPTPEIVAAANKDGKTNNLSYVLRLTYKDVRIIFGGDAEYEVWEDIVKRYGKELKCAILKASHHGRDSAYHQKAVEYMSPQFTIVSVGEKPETDASNKYRQYSKNVWSTRWKGNITLSIDDHGKSEITSQYNR